jgi:hypothetical protein
MLAAALALIGASAPGWRVCRPEGGLMPTTYGEHLYSLGATSRTESRNWKRQHPARRFRAKRRRREVGLRDFSRRADSPHL